MKNKNKILAVLATIAPAAVFAEGGYTVPTAVTTAISSLEDASTAYANVILPYIVAVGLAFVGIAVCYLLFRVFRKFVGGGK